jgi:hypothetical protein
MSGKQSKEGKSESKKTPSSSNGSHVYLCSFPGCGNNRKSGGFCIRHGGGHRCKSGQLGTRYTRASCSTPGCVNIAKVGGLCIKHGGGYRCKYEGCNKPLKTKTNFCPAHSMEEAVKKLFQLMSSKQPSKDEDRPQKKRKGESGAAITQT